MPILFKARLKRNASFRVTKTSPDHTSQSSRPSSLPPSISSSSRVKTSHERGESSQNACSPSRRVLRLSLAVEVVYAAYVRVCVSVCLSVFARVHARLRVWVDGTNVDYIGTCAPRDCRVSAEKRI